MPTREVVHDLCRRTIRSALHLLHHHEVNVLRDDLLLQSRNIPVRHLNIDGQNPNRARSGSIDVELESKNDQGGSKTDE